MAYSFQSSASGTGNFTLIVIGLVLLGLPVVALNGATPAAFSEMFSTNTRVSGFGVAYGIGTAVFSGTTPFMLTSLVKETGSQLSPAWYLIAAGLVSLPVAMLTRETFKQANPPRDSIDVPARGITTSTEGALKQ